MQNIDDLDADLLAVADLNARDCEYLRSDLAASLFPQSKQSPSEEMLAFIRRDSRALLQGLAAAIMGDGPDGAMNIDATAQAGDIRHFYADPILLEFLIARYASCRLEKRIVESSDTALSETLPALFLTDADHNIADCGQIILAASGLRRRGSAAEWNELPSELLHKAVWRVVAELEQLQPKSADHLRKNAQKILAGHSENQQAAVAAQKVLHLLSDHYVGDLGSLGKAGLFIFVANIASKLKLDGDHVLRLIDGPSLSACAIMQRALGIGQDQAIANIYLLYGFNLTPRDIMLFETGYQSVSPDAAAQGALGWHIARLQSLGAGAANRDGRP